jgi:hypothetical protein
MKIFLGEIHQPFETKKLEKKKKKNCTLLLKEDNLKIGIHTNIFSGGPVKSDAIL